jgi:hypothetical protein
MSATTDEALGASLQYAAKELPEGWQIHVTIERGSGWARLYNAEGVRADDFDSGDLNLHESIRHGVELALQQTDCTCDVPNRGLAVVDETCAACGKKA